MHTSSYKIQHEPPAKKNERWEKEEEETDRQPSKPRNSFGTYWDMSPFSKVSQTFVTWIESPPAIFLTELLFVLKISIRKMTVRDFQSTVRVDSNFVQSNEQASRRRGARRTMVVVFYMRPISNCSLITRLLCFHQSSSSIDSIEEQYQFTCRLTFLFFAVG